MTGLSFAMGVALGLGGWVLICLVGILIGKFIAVGRGPEPPPAPGGEEVSSATVLPMRSRGSHDSTEDQGEGVVRNPFTAA